MHLKLVLALVGLCLAIAVTTAVPLKEDIDEELEKVVNEVRDLLERKKGGEAGGKGDGNKDGKDDSNEGGKDDSNEGGKDDSNEGGKDDSHGGDDGKDEDGSHSAEEFDCSNYKSDKNAPFHEAVMGDYVKRICEVTMYLHHLSEETGCDVSYMLDALEQNSTWPDVPDRDVVAAISSIRPFIENAQSGLSAHSEATVDNLDAVLTTLKEIGNNGTCEFVSMVTVMARMELFGVENAPSCKAMFGMGFALEHLNFTQQDHVCWFVHNFDAALKSDLACVQRDVQHLLDVLHMAGNLDTTDESTAPTYNQIMSDSAVIYSTMHHLGIDLALMEESIKHYNDVVKTTGIDVSQCVAPAPTKKALKIPTTESKLTRLLNLLKEIQETK